MIQEFPEGLCILLESAIMYGQNDELLNFLASENATLDDFDCIINKLGENLDDCFDFPVVLDNILLLIGEILSIADLSLEQTVILSRSLLSISSNVNCSISNTKQVLNMLNKFFDDQQVASWLINDKSLEIVIVALGKRLFVIGDFECQIVMFEVMCRLASCVHDKIYWAGLWFSPKQLKAKFLNLRQDRFEQDSRKILNYINMMEPIPRVFSFVAKSVWLGELQLQKPQDSDFWIDLSFGSQIISFFCSEIFSEEDDPPWETVSISAGMIDNYTICDNAEEEMTTLILQLKCSCNQLISTNSESVQFGRDEVKITFWFPDHNIKKLIARLLEEDYEEEKIELSENLQIGKRKISVSTEITSCEQFEETEASVIKRRKLSESSDLLNVNELQETEAIQQGHRKISESKNLMNAFEIKNDPVLPSVRRKLSEIDELMETHQIEETNILPKKTRKLSQSKEIITSEENETNAISIEQVKTAIDEVLKTNIVEKEKTNETDIFKLPIEDDSQYIISATPVNQRASTNKIKERKLKSSLSLKSQRRLDTIRPNFTDAKVNNVKSFCSMSNNCTDRSDLRDKIVNLTPQVQPKRVKLFNVDSTPMYNKPPTLRSSQVVKNKNIFVSNDSNMSQLNANDEENFSNESILETKKTKISDEENLVIKSKNDLALTQVRALPASKLNDTVAVEFDDLNLPCLDVFSYKEPPKEEDLQKDTGAKKKKNSPCSKKENTAKKRTRRKQTQKQNFSSDADSDSQIISDKNSKKKIEKKKIQRQKMLDEDFDTRTLENKKPRSAALNAKKKNKSLLQQKELDENSIHSSTVKRKYESEDDVSCYSPKKKKNKACSIFQTDTETQSSEISWFKRGKRGLFQTPPLKNYTRKNAKGKTSLKKWKQQGAIQKKREYQKKTKFFDDKSSESGTKSKSMGLSDIDKFSLVVEKESPKKMANVRKSTNFHFELLNSVNEKELNATSDENLNRNFTDNDIIGGHSNQRFLDKLSLPKEAKKNISKDNKIFKIKPVKQKEKFLHCKDLKISDEKSKLKNVRKFDRCVKDDLGTSLNAFDKIHDDLCSTIQNFKFRSINQNNYSKSEGDQMDINIQHPETLFNGSESRSEFTATLNIQEEKCDLSKPSSLPDIHQTDENVCRTLSIESLNSLEELQNEESGKQLHMKLFLESLSSESPPPPSDMGDFCARVVSKRSSSQCSYSVNEIRCKKIKTDKNQNDQSDLQFSPKKTEKKVKQKLNEDIGSIVKNRKSEKIFIHSEQKSPSSPNKQFKDKKQNKADLRIHQNIIKNVSKMKQMSSKEKLNMEKNLSYSVLTKLASEVNLLTKKLFGTLQKCTWNFCNELNILRSNFLVKIEDMISHNTNLSEKDLKKLALNCKESRLQIQTNFEQITEFGRIYFEAEQMKEKKLKNVHRKITVKYCSHLRAAVEVAVKSIEERIVGRAGAMFKKFLQGI